MVKEHAWHGPRCATTNKVCMGWEVRLGQTPGSRPRVSQHFSTCKQLTKTFGSKHPAIDWLIVVYCSSVNFVTMCVNVWIMTRTRKQWFAIYMSIRQNMCIRWGGGGEGQKSCLYTGGIWVIAETLVKCCLLLVYSLLQSGGWLNDKVTPIAMLARHWLCQCIAIYSYTALLCCADYLQLPCTFEGGKSVANVQSMNSE